MSSEDAANMPHGQESIVADAFILRVRFNKPAAATKIVGMRKRVFRGSFLHLFYSCEIKLAQDSLCVVAVRPWYQRQCDYCQVLTMVHDTKIEYTARRVAAQWLEQVHAKNLQKQDLASLLTRFLNTSHEKISFLSGVYIVMFLRARRSMAFSYSMPGNEI